jgi:D-serine deaminase-like pyridoxal phosphate-dependent protein
MLSPALVVFVDLVRRNLDAMIALARKPERLRPHVKTHKMPAVVRMLEERGIHTHKCATIAEAEMIAAAGGRDLLLAYPLVGPNIARMARLADAFPETTFRALVDDPEAARALSAAIRSSRRGRLPVLIDLEVGMGRTGIDPAAADDLARLVTTLPGLTFDGLHAYDGHIRTVDPAERVLAARPGLDAVLALRDRLQAAGIDPGRLVLGGTPTFPVHAALEEPATECSPGTCIFHDASYARTFPDLPFTPAAALLTRVVSRPRPGRRCLDLGHKAVAADPPAGKRVVLLNVPDYQSVIHNEEHLVVETPAAENFQPGDEVYAMPSHICPTCALHAFAYVVENGRVSGTWDIASRDRVLTV